MAVTKSSETVTTADMVDAPRLFGPRGRHRRPRPRKVLLAAGGLALAAGALSLVRVTPESGPGTLGAPEAEPWLDPAASVAPSTDRSTNAAAAVDSAPRVSPSATSALGGPHATPTAPPSFTPPPTTTPMSTTIPEVPNTTPRPPSSPTTTTAPTPTPTPTPSSPASPSTTPPPSADPSGRPGVCVPVIGLCVDPLTARRG